MGQDVTDKIVDIVEQLIPGCGEGAGGEHAAPYRLHTVAVEVQRLRLLRQLEGCKHTQRVP